MGNKGRQPSCARIPKIQARKKPWPQFTARAQIFFFRLGPVFRICHQVPMRVPILLTCAAFFLNAAAHAQPLSDSDREALLENLEKIRQTADSKVESKFRTAISAYRSAMSSDDAAFTLYLNCIEKINFTDQNRKSSDFREWKRKEDGRFSDPGFRPALRHQLRWLVLTLQASAKDTDRIHLASEAQVTIDAIFRDTDRLRSQEELLGQAVTASVFARAYGIENLKMENWPLSPIQLEPIYEQILLPPNRNPERIAELRSTWIKRIQQEALKVEYADAKNRDNRSGMPSQEMTRFLDVTSPKLQWNMEVDLFRNGDESGAAKRMFEHLEKYISHSSAREWSDEFRNLLKPEIPNSRVLPTNKAP
jgi:hypothetical protein